MDRMATLEGSMVSAYVPRCRPAKAGTSPNRCPDSTISRVSSAPPSILYRRRHPSIITKKLLDSCVGP
jgi:hypothetical protein